MKSASLAACLLLSGCAAAAAHLEAVDTDAVLACGEADTVAGLVHCLGLEHAKAAHRAAGVRCVREVSDAVVTPEDAPDRALQVWQAHRAIEAVERLKDG